MGQPIPADLDGRALTEALHKEWIDTHRLAPVVMDADQARQHDGFSAADEEAVRQRLQDLGYLG
jgi:hypothetical protein